MFSFIYFDLGGVAIDDFTGNNKWQELGDEMGLTDENRDGFKRFWGQHELEFCTSHHIDPLPSRRSTWMANFLLRFCRPHAVYKTTGRLFGNARIYQINRLATLACYSEMNLKDWINFMAKHKNWHGASRKRILKKKLKSQGK